MLYQSMFPFLRTTTYNVLVWFCLSLCYFFFICLFLFYFSFVLSLSVTKHKFISWSCIYVLGYHVFSLFHQFFYIGFWNGSENAVYFLLFLFFISYSILVIHFFIVYFIKDWSQFFFGSWRNKQKNVVHTV